MRPILDSISPKGFIIEYEKDGSFALVIIVAGSPEQALAIARQYKQTDKLTILDETEVIFAD